MYAAGIKGSAPRGGARRRQSLGGVESFLVGHATGIAVVAITLLMVLIAFVFYQQEETNSVFKAEVQHTYEVKEHIQSFVILLGNAVISERGYLIAGQDKYLDSYRNDIRGLLPSDENVDAGPIGREWKMLKKLTSDNPVQQKNLDDVNRGLVEFVNYLDSRIEARRTTGPGTLQNFDPARGEHLVEQLQNLVDTMTAEEDRLLAIRSQQEESGVQKNNFFIFAGMAAFYILVVFSIWLCQKAERRAQQQSVRDALSLKMAIDVIADGLIVIDDKSRVQSFNPAAERIFGYKPEDVIGQDVKMLMPVSAQAGRGGYIENYLASGDAKIGAGRETTGKRKDGSIFPMEFGLREMRVEGKRFFTGTIRDITERKQVEQDRERYIADLKQSNQELDDFAYIASHDLKEPLRGLTNNAMFLKEDFADRLDEKTVKHLDRMTYLCQRMERLMDDLLYFSRLGRQNLAIQRTDLNEVIKDIRTMMEASLREANAAIVTPEPLPTVVCDLPRITEVFRNLVTNAVKYNKSAEKRIEIGCLKPSNDESGITDRTFYVRDNGIGISRQFYADVFRIFKRLNDEDDATKGTGVGLTFVRKIVERHGGKIWLESELGQGTTFYFTLNTGKEAA